MRDQYRISNQRDLEMADEAKPARLRELITEGLRVQRDVDAITYINVGHALEDASARANHVIFARRGCGKTLLLHDSRSKLNKDIKSIYLNCEDFKQHTFPNVLVEILKALFLEIDRNPSGWFGKKARTKTIVKHILERLEKMHQAPDDHVE
jgi:Cdc6-like AAA superfamily ATPase